MGAIATGERNRIATRGTDDPHQLQTKYAECPVEAENSRQKKGGHRVLSVRAVREKEAANAKRGSSQARPKDPLHRTRHSKKADNGPHQTTTKPEQAAHNQEPGTRTSNKDTPH